jgi:hypothetical protein
LALEPTQQFVLPRLALKDWHSSSKQALAEYVAQGVLEVAEVNSSHLYQDKGNNLAYAVDSLGVGTPAQILANTLLFAADYQTKVGAHVASLAVHTAATLGFVGAVPTDLPSLIIWLAAARLVYETNHRPSGAAHPFIDIVNTSALVPPVDLATSVQEMRNLAVAYNGHKTWWLESTASVLNIPAILTY